MSLRFLSLPRRFKRYLPYVAWVSLLSALPIAVLLAFSHHRSLAHAEMLLESTVERAVHETDRMLEEARESLNIIAASVDEDESVLSDSLVRVVYDSPYFREAGVVDAEGWLIRTSLGPVDPPRQVETRADPDVAGLQMLGAEETVVMHRRSMILSLALSGGGEVNLLVDPGILLYFVDPVDEISLGPNGFVAFLKRDGSLIALDGTVPPDGRVHGEKRRGRIRVRSGTAQGEVVVVPGLFIPAAEKTGLISAVGEWVLRRAIEEQRTLMKQFPKPFVSINLSPIQLNTGAADAIVQWLETPSVPRERVVFEITEGAVLRESETTAVDTMARLRSLGCQVALDDFGTGYSSLSYIHKFEFDYLKIDRQFVRGIDTDVRTNPILEAMVQLAAALGVEMVAEGVETEAQRRFLRGLGVRYAQGWLFSRPLPIGAYAAFLERGPDSSESRA